MMSSETTATCLKLAANGRTDYVIVVGAAAHDAEVYAAGELAKFLKQITGAVFPTHTDDVPVSAHEIVVGRTNRLAVTDLPSVLVPTAWEGFALVREQDRLVILGNMPRATVYGVYDFLHEELGCRFLTPECTHVPHRSTLTIEGASRRYDPPLEYREVWNGLAHQPQHTHSPKEHTAFDDVWAVRNHLNLMGSSGPMEAMLGKIKWVGPSFVHTFNYMVPVEELFDEHPEYFAEIDGRRVRTHGGQIPQLCLTNPDVLRLCLDRARQWIDAEVPNEQSKFFVSVTINDTEVFCKCAACVAINREEGVDEGGTKMRFVNAMAEQLAEQYPNVSVETMIYKTDVPKKTKPGPNAIIRNVSGIDWRRGLDDLACPATVRTLDRLEELRKAAGDRGVYNWSKHVQFDDFLRPFPNLRNIARNIRIMRANGVVGTFAQNQQSRAAEMQDLRFYLLARAMWRPDRDSGPIIEEFCRLYYGPASEEVLRYLDFLHDEYGHTAPELDDLDEVFIAKGDAILAKAESRADTPERKQRVATMRLPYWHMMLKRAYREEGKVLDLPTEWHFRIDPEVEGEKAGWPQATDFSAWSTMRIDRHWTLQGEDHRGIAWYGTHFDLPDTGDADLAICFEAVDGKCDVFVDGRKIGEQKLKADMAWTLPFFVPLGKGCPPGPHTIVVRVDKDYENSGIWRPITIVDMSTPLPPALRTAGKRFLDVARAGRLANITECYGDPGLQVEAMLYPNIEYFLSHGDPAALQEHGSG